MSAEAEMGAAPTANPPEPRLGDDRKHVSGTRFPISLSRRKFDETLSGFPDAVPPHQVVLRCRTSDVMAFYLSTSL
jgi:hypothetical protein